MRSKHLFPLGILIGLALLTVATSVYPGGSQVDANATGFDWKQNYLCNLFDATAVNGAPNTARIWAISGWLIFCVTMASFFIGFAKKISIPGAARIIRIGGILGTLCFFLAATPLHNIALTCALVFMMISVLLIVIMMLRSRYLALKILGFFCMASGYFGYTIYYTRTLLYVLPTIQKVTLGAFLIYFLCLHYFTTAQDFPAPSPKPSRPTL